jgi:hypothetical protein
VWLTVLALSVYGLPQGRAEETTPLKINRSLIVNEVGDAQVKVEVKIPAASYTAVKTVNPNVTGLLRRIGAGTHWAKLDNLRGRFDDFTRSAVIEYTQLGVARMAGEDLWEIALGAEAKLDLLHSAENIAILSGAVSTDLGTGTLNLRVEAPKAAKDLQLKPGPQRISYHFSPTVEQGTNPGVSFEMEVRSRIMSALAKSYSNEQLADLWVARSILKNTGSQMLLDYRVHSRLGGMGEWSAWKRTKRVLPGQTIVDAFFPILEVDKLGEMTSDRPMMLDVEYEYRQQDGRVVREADSRQVQLLGRNQAVFSSLSQDDGAGFYENYNFAPVILASFVSGDDAPMRELAGRLSRSAGVSAVSEKDDDARKFLSACYEFFNTNNVRCQASASAKSDTHAAQSLKYGRDVILNKSGSAVDLAILFASVCENVGLKPELFLTAGNCLPAVRLPGGQSVTVDMSAPATQSYAKAVEAGEKQLQEARDKGEILEIDIAKWRSLGVHGLDLPRFESGYLEANYRFTGSGQNYQAQSGQNPSSTTTGSGKQPAANLVGRWVLEQATRGVNIRYTMTLSSEGKYSYRAAAADGSQAATEAQESGTFQQEETWLKFSPDGGGQSHTYFYHLRGDDLELQLQGTSTPAVFHRAR